MLLTPAQIKPKSFESRRNSFFFLPGMDAPHVYVCAWALGCFHSLIGIRTFRRALTASVDSCAEINWECPFSGVTKSGRVWRKVPESDARSVSAAQTPSGTGLLHPSFNHCLFSYAIGSRKLLANEQFFVVGAQTVISLLQTAQIKQGVSFIAANKVYTSTNKTTIVWIETEII